MRWHGMTMFAAAAAVVLLGTMTAPVTAAAQSDSVLKAAEVQKLLPDSVWYKGQSAPAQKRNSGGVKFGDGSFVLATLVDNSGYASDVAAKYQAYFVVETSIKIGGQTLAPGVYGAGFITGDKFVVTDVGGNPEIVRHECEGLLVPRGDAAACAAAFRRLFDDAALAEHLGAAGRARVVERYQLSRTVERYYELYRRLAGRD